MQTQTVSIQEKNSIISAMAKHFAVFEVKAELDQLLCGLSSTLGVLELLRSDPALMRPLLVHTPTNPVTADDVFDAFVFCYSPIGSNSREKEEATIMLWVHFLQRIECKHVCSCMAKLCHNEELILSSILADCLNLPSYLYGYCVEIFLRLSPICINHVVPHYMHLPSVMAIIDYYTRTIIIVYISHNRC